MPPLCPHCQQPLSFEDAAFHCTHCQCRFASQAICPTCKQPLQILKACGAVDYFCPNDDGLISKSRVEFTPLIETL